jgi:uncharacterized protein (DUF2141 family)
MQGIEGYTSVRPVTLTAAVPISNGTARWRADVPPGTYALIAHHDRNANGALDRPLLGLPLEPYGYSNGAWTSLGLPAYDAVAFDVGKGTAPQRIRLRMNGFVTLAQILVSSTVALGALLALVAVRRRRAVQQT